MEKLILRVDLGKLFEIFSKNLLHTAAVNTAELFGGGHLPQSSIYINLNSVHLPTPP